MTLKDLVARLQRGDKQYLPAAWLIGAAGVAFAILLAWLCLRPPHARPEPSVSLPEVSARRDDRAFSTRDEARAEIVKQKAADDAEFNRITDEPEIKEWADQSVPADVAEWVHNGSTSDASSGLSKD